MSDTTMVAVVIIGLIPIIGSIMAIIKPIIKLNETISRLSEKINVLIEDRDELTSRLKIVEDTVNILSRQQELYGRDLQSLSEKLEDCKLRND